MRQHLLLLAAQALWPQLSRRTALGGLTTTVVAQPFQPAVAAGDDIFRPAAGSLAGRTVVVTGANSGLGLETAARLAAAGADVVATARTDAKAKAAVAAVKEQTGVTITGVALDLADLSSVKSLPSRLPAKKIDVLVENAGVMAIPERLTTRDGFERQIGVNHLGHFALVAALLPLLEKAGTFRVVAVSSSAHTIPSAKNVAAGLDAGLDPDYNAWGNYGLSKACNVLFAKELQRRFDAKGLSASAVALHPGVVQTDLARYMVQGVDAVEKGVSLSDSYNDMGPLQKQLMVGMSKFVLPVSKGANTQVYLAAAADLAAGGGAYYDDMKPAKNSAAVDDPALAARLWALSEKLTGTKIDL